MSVAVAVVVVLALPTTARAWKVKSGFTPGCHERLATGAFEGFILDIPPTVLLHEVPADETWREVYHFVLDFLPVDDTQMDDVHRFLLVSLIIGVRAPDTDGHSILSVENMRSLHADPSPEGQYAHGLRGLDDDYQEGDLAAVNGTRAVIIELLELSKRYFAKEPGEQIIAAEFYLDFYGQIDLPVWAPFYYLGRAAHAVQDTFTHAIRTENDDFRKIVHVMNYIDALSGDIDEARDGLAHSDSMDDCDDPDTAGIFAAAQEATIDLFFAFRADSTGVDPRAMDHFFERWMEVLAGCTLENDFCGNVVSLDLALEKQTGPYLESFFGCQSAGGSGRSTVPMGTLLVILSLLLVRRRWRG